MSNKVIKAGFGYTIGNYLIKGLSFLTIPIFARILSTTDYGAYSTYIAYESIMASIIGCALHTSLKNAKIKYKNKYDDYCASILLLEVITLVVWLVIGLLCSSIIKTYLDFTFPIVILLIIHCSCSTILSIYNVHLSITYSYKSYIIIALVNAIANITGSLFFILVLYNDNRYFGRVLGTVIPLILVSVFVVYHFWRNKKPNINIEYWKYAIGYSMPLIPHAISQVILNQFDRIMIKSMIGLSQSGIYSFGYNIYTIIEVTKNSLDNVWSPWFYENFSKSNYELIREKSTYYAFGMSVFTSCVMLISPELIKIMGSSSYYDSAYVVIPICAGGYFSFLYTLPAQVEYFLGKTNYIAIGTVLAATLNIILNFVFIKKFGYIAAAYTTEVTYIVYFLVHLYISKKLVNIQLFEIKKLFFCSFIVLGLSIYGVIYIYSIFYRYIMAMTLLVIVFIVLLVKKI